MCVNYKQVISADHNFIACCHTYIQHTYIAERHVSKQIYEREMQHGYIDLGIDKVVLFGIAGSGKTLAPLLLCLESLRQMFGVALHSC